MREGSEKIKRDERGHRHVDREEASAVAASNAHHHRQVAVWNVYLCVYMV